MCFIVTFCIYSLLLILGNIATPTLWSHCPRPISARWWNKYTPRSDPGGWVPGATPGIAMPAWRKDLNWRTPWRPSAGGPPSANWWRWTRWPTTSTSWTRPPPSSWGSGRGSSWTQSSPASRTWPCTSSRRCSWITDHLQLIQSLHLCQNQEVIWLLLLNV